MTKKIIIDVWSNKQIHFRLVNSERSMGYQNFNDESFSTVFGFFITFNMGGSFTLYQCNNVDSEQTVIRDYEHIADIFKDTLENGEKWT